MINIDLYNDHLMSVTYEVSCYDRTISIISVVGNYSRSDIYKLLDEAYDRWTDIENHPEVEPYCCEEYLLECLPEDFKQDIQCVIYGREDEE